MIGLTKGSYRFLERLGAGGMGQVYLAEDQRLGRRVAIKCLHGSAQAEDRLSTRLRREARALAALNHPGIVTVHSVEEIEGHSFLVMEWLDGRTLADVLGSGALGWPVYFDLARQLAAAVAAAHTAGVLHRDLKPANVMVLADRRLKVLDFGLSRMQRVAGENAPTLTSVTEDGTVMGTADYMPPEAWRGERLDHRSDVYSLGVIMHEMATGSRLFRGNPTEVAAATIYEAPQALRVKRPDAPEALVRLVADCLAKRREDRPASVDGMLARLTAIQAEAPSGPAAAPDPEAESAAGAERPRADPAIERLLLQGKRLWNKRSEDSFHEAAATFQKALELDPLEQRAWVGVADSFNMLANYGFVQPSLVRARAIAAAERAIELDRGSSEARRALGFSAFQFDFDWPAAERLYREAIALAPGNGLTHYWLSVLLAVTGRFDEAFESLDRTEALDPLALYVPPARGWFLLFAGRDEESLRQLKDAIRLEPNQLVCHWFLGQTLVELEDFSGARAAFSEAIRLGGRTSRMLGYLGYAEGRAGATATARETLAELDERGRAGYVPPYFRALALSGLGEREAALAALERSLRERDTMLRDLRVDPSFRRLRSEERYAALLRALKLSL